MVADPRAWALHRRSETFTYTAEAPDGSRDDGTVSVDGLSGRRRSPNAPEVEPGDGFAKNDAAKVGAWRSTLIRVDKNDDFDKKAGAKVVAIDGKADCARRDGRRRLMAW